MNKKALAIIFLTTLTVISNSLLAIIKDYQVELIVFKYNNYDSVYKESWPFVELDIPKNAVKITEHDSNKTNVTIDSDNNINTTSRFEFNDKFGEEFDNDDFGANKTEQATNNKYYKYLEDRKLKYSNIYNRIKNNSRYKVISHIGWQTPRKDVLKSRPITIETGTVYQTTSKTTVVSSDMSSALPINYNEHNTQVYTISTPEISGIIKFNLKRFVHADLDLILNLPVKPSNAYKKPFEIVTADGIDENTYLQTFRIKEERRLKNNELNYFDNPAFGAILVVSELKN